MPHYYQYNTLNLQVLIKRMRGGCIIIYMLGFPCKQGVYSSFFRNAFTR